MKYIPKENSYGIVKRFTFITSLISSINNKEIKILDFGCGSGELLTIPLAEHFQDRVKIFAFDSDNKSTVHLIEISKKKKLHNIVVIDDLDQVRERKFDVIIVSEVLEHIEVPERFLYTISQLLNKDGKIILTVPNGLGYFEFDQTILGIAELAKIYSLLRNIKRRFLSKKNIVNKVFNKDSCGESPHIQFFTYKQLLKLFKRLNLNVELYDGRAFLSGFLLGRIVDRFDFLVRWNNVLGSYLPAYLVSGWMFILVKETELVPCDLISKKTFSDDSSFFYRQYVKFKRRINLHR